MEGYTPPMSKGIEKAVETGIQLATALAGVSPPV